MDYFNKGNCYYSNKDYRNAILMYIKAVEQKDNEASSKYNAAVCFIKLKEYENSISLLKSAIKLNPQSKYYYNLAYCYLMLKNTQKALMYFNKAWSIDNNDNDCEKAINSILSKLRKAQ